MTEVRLHTLADIARAHDLTAKCEPCGRTVRLNTDELAERLGWDATLPQVRAAVKCRRCGRKTGRILVGYRAPEAT